MTDLIFDKTSRSSGCTFDVSPSLFDVTKESSLSFDAAPLRDLLVRPTYLQI